MEERKFLRGCHPEKTLKTSSGKKKDMDSVKTRRENKWGRLPCKPQVSGDTGDAQLCWPGEETENVALRS